MDSVAAPGIATPYAREDHVHPSDTTKASTTAVSAEIAAKAVRYDTAQALSVAQQAQARSNIYAAPFDALAYNGMQINGSFEVDQPNAGAAIAVAAGSVGHQNLMDGWWVAKTGTDALSVQQAASVFPGYSKELKLTITTAQLSGGADTIQLLHSIEGSRSARLQWGTPSAQPLTVGFWVKSSVAGPLPVQILSSVSGAVGAVVTIASANVAQFASVTFPGQTTGTWPTDNSIGCIVSINPMQSGGINIAATNGNTFEITGLIVLPGVEAPSAARAPFIMRPYDQEFLFSLRYLEVFNYLNGGAVAVMQAFTASSAFGALPFKVQKRIAPTMTSAGSIVALTGGAASAGGTLSFPVPQTFNTSLVMSGCTGLVIGNASFCQATSMASITADARL